jgi:CDP-glycerol glycerophosphotransferase (TagB/SpsB family)
VKKQINEKVRVLRRHVKRKLIRTFQNIAYVLDKKHSKKSNVWAFPVCYISGQLFDNARVVFEKIKNDPNIKKIVLYRSKDSVLDITGSNLVIVKLHSLIGYYWLFRSGVVFVRHCISQDVGFRIDNENRLIVNLWHGIALKTIGTQTKNFSITGTDPFGAIICSSISDKKVMLDSFAYSTHDNTWVTGLPRNDLLNIPPEQLWPEVRQELELIVKRKKGKKLILFAPTFRANWENWENKVGYYQFSKTEIKKLKELSNKYHYVIGIRTHLREERAILKAFSGIDVLIFNDINETSMVLRETDILISDYSSIAIDFLLLKRPVFSFAYDYDNYKEGRGFIYNLSHTFPTALCHNFDKLIHDIENAIQEPNAIIQNNQYQEALDIFHDNEYKCATDLLLSNINKKIKI